MRSLTLCVLALALGCALLVQQPGCTEGGHYALVRSLADGAPSIDRYHWSTCDTSWYHGHFYTAKGPGLALAAVPFYVVLRSAGLVWNELPPVDGHLHGIPGHAVWPFTVLLVLLSACALLLAVRRVAEWVAPGFGTLTAVVLALGTMLLPYSTLFASHLPAAMLGFAAFVVLCAERRGARSLPRLAVAGALAGLAIVFDPPLGLTALVLAAYALSRGPRAVRLAAYAAGGLAGILPLLAFDQWAFGSVVHQSYNDTVAIAGQSGHDQLGANANGFFGIALPSVNVAVRLLLLNRGLLVTTPVVAAACAGLVLLVRRREWRAEALTVIALIAAYLVYNAGYYQPFGGDSAGPRFLIPILPFLCLPLALAFRRLPATTGALAAISVAMMLTATVTQPMLEGDDTRTWFSSAAHGAFADTLLTRAGIGSHTLAIVPTALLLLAALVLAFRSVPRPTLEQADARAAVAAIVAWAVLASSAPALLASSLPAAASTAIVLVLFAAGLALVAVSVRTRSPASASS
jgi:hypothetical protein